MNYLTRSVVITALAAGALGFLVAPAVAAAPPAIQIGSAPVFAQKAIYFDGNQDGQAAQNELIGDYSVYNSAAGIQFSWTAMPGANSYRVWMIQYDPPGTGPAGPSHVIKVGHHLSSDPNPLQYTMSGWGIDETFCLDCVSVIVVQPEIATPILNGQGGEGYSYTSLPGMIFSSPFVLENWAPAGSGGGSHGAPVCGDGICSPLERICGGRYYCPVSANNGNGDCPDSCS